MVRTMPCHILKSTATRRALYLRISLSISSSCNHPEHFLVCVTTESVSCQFFEGDDGGGDDRAPFANLAPRDNFLFPAARHFFFPSHESGARSKSTNLDGA